MRVGTRCRSPRAKTATATCGASPSAAAGLRVTISQRPSASVGQRPKPRQPSPGACHVSTSASGTGAPSPSYTKPWSVTAPSPPGSTTAGPSSHGSPIEKNGPTVCGGVASGILERGPGQDDVPAVGERPLGLRALEVEGGDEPLARRGVAHRVEDRVLPEQRVAREVHLRDEPLGERAPE